MRRSNLLVGNEIASHKSLAMTLQTKIYPAWGGDSVVQHNRNDFMSAGCKFHAAIGGGSQRGQFLLGQVEALDAPEFTPGLEHHADFLAADVVTAHQPAFSIPSFLGAGFGFFHC